MFGGGVGLDSARLDKPRAHFASDLGRSNARRTDACGQGQGGSRTGRCTVMPGKFQHHRPAFGRGHLATVLASACAALLVGLGVGTGREAESADAIGTGIGGAPAIALADGITDINDRGFVGTLTGHGAEAARAPALTDTILARILPGRFGRSGLASNPARGADPARTSAASDATEVASYNGRPIRLARTMRMKVTAYSPDYRSCGASADGITASGFSVLTNGGFMVAADPRVLPLGSLVSVPGYDGGAVVPVLDTGGAIKGSRLDVLFPTHEVAMQWGVRDIEVGIWEYADGLPNGFRRLRRPSSEPRVQLPAGE
jgi:3D (Asp-Asp-Asp) domain-containing protein